MSSRVVQVSLRLAVVAVLIASVTVSFAHHGTLALVVSVPAMAGLAWRGTTAYLVASGLALLVCILALPIEWGFAPDAPPLMAMTAGLALVTVLAAWVGWDYLAIDQANRHEERQTLEDLEEQVVRLREEVEGKEKFLTLGERRRRRYGRLQDSATALAASLDVGALAQVVLEQAANLLGDMNVGLSLVVFDAAGKEAVNLHRDLGSGLAPVPAGKAAEDPLNAWVLGRGATLVIRDLEKDFRFRALEGAGLKGRCFYLSPFLNSQGQATGILRVESALKDAIEIEDQRLLESLVVLASLALENAKLYKETQELAVTDGLTKLLLRRPLMERLDAEVKRASQGGSPLCLLMLDIDHFKGVNDTYGHPAGDQVLREVAGLVKRSVRDVDFCGRYGGEEFAVILPETDLAGGRVVAERIREAVRAKPFELKGEKRLVTASLGVAAFPVNAANAHDLINRADEALYRSKDAGRDRVSTCDGGGNG